MSTTTETTVRERPILFSAPMVRAILEGRKSCTRRIVKPQPETVDYPARYLPNEWGFYNGAYPPHGKAVRSPYGKPGERLFVKEAYRPTFHPELWDCVEYRADGVMRKPEGLTSEQGYRFSDACGVGPGRWKSSLFMPRWASRITLEVTGVRVERVKDISEADVESEGAIGVRDNLWGWENWDGGCWDTAQAAYAYLFDKINGAGSWDANPWVWVVEFKPVGAP